MAIRYAWTLVATLLLLSILPLFAGSERTSVGGAALPANPWPEIARGAIMTVVQERTLPATLAPHGIAFYGVAGLDVDHLSGDLYLIDKARHMIFRVDREGHHVEPFAGAQVGGFNGDGRPARDTLFHVPAALAVDPSSGDIYVADTQNHRVRMISRSGGRVTTVAGVGIRGVSDDRLPTVFPAIDGFRIGHYSGDGGLAAEAELNLPAGAAVDSQGIVFIADSGNQRIRAINRGSTATSFGKVEIRPGHIETVAGTGIFGFAGDGENALSARLAFPTELKVDPGGNVLIVDTFNHRIRRIDRATGTIVTIARGRYADGDPRSSLAAWRISIVGLAVTAAGEIVYTDRAERTVYRIASDGAVAPITINGIEATGPGSIAVGSGGEIFLADVYYNRVLELGDGGLVSFAGGASAIEGGPAMDVAFSVLGPLGIDTHGDLFLADAMHYSVRRIRRSTGLVETFMGSGFLGTGGDNGPPERAELVHPTAILIDQEVIYIADQYGNVIRSVARDKDRLKVATFAGRSGSSVPEEGGPANQSRLGGPLAVAKHPVTGEIYVACQESHSIRKIDVNGNVITVAGTGQAGDAGDGGPARDAQFNWPAALAFQADGTLYVSDMLNNRIRKIEPNGRISGFAGTGRRGFAGDGGPAPEAQLNFPGHLVFDRFGNLYVSDTNNHRVRRIRVGPPYQIDTVVGNGLRGFSGDGGPATEARLNLPRGLAFGADGLLYVVDSFNRKVRAVRLADAP